MIRLDKQRTVIKTNNAGHNHCERVGNGNIIGWRSDGFPPDVIHCKLYTKRSLSLRHCALCRDKVIVAWRIVHIKALTLKPGLYGTYLRLRLRKLLAELGS